MDIDINQTLPLVAKQGYSDLVSMLLDNGADINAQNINERTALMKAAQHGNSETIALLLERGASTEPRDKYGNTALMLAVQRGKKVNTTTFKTGLLINGLSCLLNTRDISVVGVVQ